MEMQWAKKNETTLRRKNKTRGLTPADPQVLYQRSNGVIVTAIVAARATAAALRLLPGAFAQRTWGHVCSHCACSEMPAGGPRVAEAPLPVA